MVLSANIKCDVCDHAFTLKYQMDKSIDIYDWPIEIVCPICNNHLSLQFRKKGGLEPKELIIRDCNQSTHIGYSASLPICKEMYYKKNETPINIFFSAAINLFQIYGPFEMKLYEHQHSLILNNVIQRKNWLKELLPFVEQGNNSTTFLKKLSLLNGTINIEAKGNAIEMYDEIVGTIYKGLSTPKYHRQRGYYASDLGQFIREAKKEQLQQLVDCTSSFLNIDDWLIKNAYEFIADIVNRIEKYLPATFFSSIGDFNIPHERDLNIMTIDYKQVSNDYARGFEELMKIVPFMAALHNLKQNGDCNFYKEGENENHNALDKFVNKTNGKKKEEIYTYSGLKDYLDYTIENHIRNGKNHEDETYDVLTQTISYHYNAERTDAIHQERLIDVSFRVYLQTLVMIEITQLINSIKKKLEEE